MRIVLLGPPGAGKGTQCKRIIEKYNLVHLSSGDILRGEKAAGTDLGNKAKDYMDSGKLVPDELIIEMMVGAMQKAGGNCCLDGFPRTVAQGQALDNALAKADENIDAVVNLILDDSVVEARMTGRRSCPKCGNVYHIDNLKPEVDNQCDDGCGELVQRKDDNPEVVKNRLTTYHKQTAPVLDYYKSTGCKIFDIEADNTIADITAAIFSKLDTV